MKSVERPPSDCPEGEWTPFEVVRVFPAPGAPPAPRQHVESHTSGSPLPGDDQTRLFLHQLSQTLTSLRGTLELALLVDSDAEEYRKAIQQSLAQAEDLVQLFKSYRASTEGETTELAHEENWK